MKPVCSWRLCALGFGGVFLALLTAAALPAGGVPEFYSGAAIWGLGGVLGALSLVACVRGLRRGKWGSAVCHAALPILLVGVILQSRAGRGLEFGVYVGDGHVARELFDEARGTTTPLAFSYCVRDFSVDYYPPVYALVERGADGVKILERARADDRGVAFPKSNVSLPREVLRDDTQTWVEFLGVDAARAVARRPLVERAYRATMRIEEGGQSREVVLGVNRPVDVGDFRFYLMSHGRNERGAYVRVYVRNRAGSGWMTAGFLAATVGAALGALRPKASRGTGRARA